MTAGRPSRDPGLQQERTSLAWSRTGLSLTGAGVFVAAHAGLSGGWPPALLAVLAALLSLAAVVQFRRLDARSHVEDHEPGFDRVLPDGRWLFVLAVVAGTLLVVEVGIAVATVNNP
jgi:putative membrane protein